MLLRVGIFYLLTWFFLLLLGGMQQATAVLPPEISLPQWAPGIAAFLMLVLFRQDNHKIVYFSRNTPVRRYLVAVLLPLAAGLVILLLTSSIPAEPAATPASSDLLLLVVLWAPVGALGEEIGWRGYLQKRLNTRLHGLVSSVLVGVLWMGIHIHFFSMGAIFLLFLALLFIAYSIVFYALVQDTGFSVLLAALIHLSINYTNLLYLDRINTTEFMMVNAIVWSIVAVVAVYLRREFFFSPKQADEVEDTGG